MTRTEKLEQAVNKLQTAYLQLISDLQSNKLTEAEMIEKHNDIHEHVVDEVDALLEVPEPNLVVEMCDGQIVAVHSQFGDLTYAVFDHAYEFDSQDVKETDLFASFKGLIEELEESRELE